MTHLRKQMLEELQRRHDSEITTRNYPRVVTEFTSYFGKAPNRLGLNKLRTCQAYLLPERKLTPGTAVNQVAALRFSSSKLSSFNSFVISCPTARTDGGCRQCSAGRKSCV